MGRDSGTSATEQNEVDLARKKTKKNRDGQTEEDHPRQWEEGGLPARSKHRAEFFFVIWFRELVAEEVESEDGVVTHCSQCPCPKSPTRHDMMVSFPREI